MALTNAEKQAAHRARQKAKMAELQASFNRLNDEAKQAPPEPPEPAKRTKGDQLYLGHITPITDDEFEWLFARLKEHREQPARVAAKEVEREEKEAALQASRKAKWDKATRTVPLYDYKYDYKRETWFELDIENRVLSATEQRITGLYVSPFDGRLNCFKLDYMGWREPENNGWWRVTNPRRYTLRGNLMGELGYRPEAASEPAPPNRKDNPHMGKPIKELRGIVSANHPDKGNPQADHQQYQWAVEAMDAARA